LFLYCRLVWKIINRCLGRMFELVFLWVNKKISGFNQINSN
jgi:hypothetical protein